MSQIIPQNIQADVVNGASDGNWLVQSIPLADMIGDINRRFRRTIEIDQLHFLSGWEGMIELTDQRDGQRFSAAKDITQAAQAFQCKIAADIFKEQTQYGGNKMNDSDPCFLDQSHEHARIILFARLQKTDRSTCG